LSEKFFEKNNKDVIGVFSYFLHRMDNFLTSDTLENCSCLWIPADYGYINDVIAFSRKKGSQIEWGAFLAF